MSDQLPTKEQKSGMPRRWVFDTCENSVADDEWTVAQNGKILREIVLALKSLVGMLDSDGTPPTKQGGLDRKAVSAGSDEK
ncbi:hypothetical protein NO357_09545 [Marimonas arenosa]|uniref:Uncharacterized protein n=1 Tax=Marimonas arenosa TaxID=1795305 RepID=A0AAE4B5A0_9RHOB|nr:hypothetical protein [Marimonas arenosa]